MHNVDFNELIHADGLRDGGTVYAKFANRKQVEWGLHLNVNKQWWQNCSAPSVHDQVPRHDHLYYFNASELNASGSRPDDENTIVELGSELEQQIVNELQRFLQEPNIRPAHSPHIDPQGQLLYVQLLLENIPKRSGKIAVD